MISTTHLRQIVSPQVSSFLVCGTRSSGRRDRTFLRQVCPLSSRFWVVRYVGSPFSFGTAVTESERKVGPDSENGVWKANTLGFKGRGPNPPPSARKSVSLVVPGPRVCVTCKYWGVMFRTGVVTERESIEGRLWTKRVHWVESVEGRRERVVPRKRDRHREGWCSVM